MAEGLGYLSPTDLYDNTTMAINDDILTTTAIAVAVKQNSGNLVLSNAINITLYIIIFLLALVGNSLVVVTLIQNKRMRSVTNVFLLSLSASDLLVICFCLPITLVGNTIHHFIFGPFLCRLVGYFQTISVAVSVWTMVAIAVERYHAICNPLASRAWQTKSRAYKIIAIIWVTAFLLALPDVIFTQLKVYDPKTMKKSCRPAIDEPFKTIYLFLLFFLFMVIPLICLFFAYGLICLELWRGIMSEKRATAKEKEENGTPMKDLKSATSSSGPDSNANDPFLRKDGKVIYRPPSAKVATRNMGHVRSTSSNNAKKRVVRMLIVLVLIFFVLWTPTWVLNMWHVVNSDKILKVYRSCPMLLHIVRLMSYISTCVNPIVYCFMNRSFRNGFLEAFSCCTKRYRPFSEETRRRHGATTTNQTRIAHRPDSTTNYTNVSSGEDD